MGEQNAHPLLGNVARPAPQILFHPKAVRSDPDMKAWREMALQETWIVEADEAGIDTRGG